MTEEKDYMEQRLYCGEVIVRFFGPTEEKPNRHIYMVKDTKISDDFFRPKSVTGIGGIKDKSRALVPWSQEESASALIRLIESKKKITIEDVVKAAFASDEKKAKAADTGSIAHEWIENYIKSKISKGSEMPEMPEDRNVAIAVNSFLEWESQTKVKYFWTEKLFYSRKYKYVGKGDIGAEIGKKKYLIDNKTANGLYNDVFAQTAAYQYADEEESGGSYDGRIAIRISKETEKEYYSRMAEKNRIKAILGKKETEIKPYKVFDARFLDVDGIGFKEDMKTFVSMIQLSDWNSETEKLLY